MAAISIQIGQKYPTNLSLACHSKCEFIATLNSEEICAIHMNWEEDSSDNKYAIGLLVHVKYVLFFIISFLSQVFLGSQDLSKHVLNEMLHNASLSTILNTMFDLGTTMVLQWVQCTMYILL